MASVDAAIWLVWHNEAGQRYVYPCRILQVISSESAISTVLLRYYQDNSIWDDPDPVSLRKAALQDEAAIHHPSKLHLDWAHRSTTVPGETGGLQAAAPVRQVVRRSNQAAGDMQGRPAKRTNTAASSSTGAADDAIFSRLQRLEELVGSIQGRLDKLDGDLTQLKGKFDAWDVTLQRMQDYQRQQAVMAEEIRKIKVAAKVDAASVVPDDALQQPAVQPTTSSDPLCMVCKQKVAYDMPLRSLMTVVYKNNPELKVKHAEAYGVWSRASSELRAKHMKAARQNAPTSERQRANFVHMEDFRQELSELKAVDDPHATCKQSLALLFLTYACCMPPKRAEVGTLYIFDTEPKPEDKKAHPNHIVLDSCLMCIHQHKTSKHEAHSAGIVEELPEEFMSALRTPLQRWPRQHLFVDNKGQGYDSKGFSKWVRRTTGHLFGDKAPGINLLRHSFCTSLDYNRLTCSERDSIALRSGHRATMQDQYRFLDRWRSP